MRRFALTAFALAGLIFCVLTSASTASADDWSKTYKLTGRPNLRVITNDAHIDLYATDAQQIDAHVTTRGWSIAKSSGDRGITITESQSGNEVTLNVHVPNMHFFFGWNNRSVRLELHVPHEADFDVETGDGSVTSEAFHGQLRISSGDGSIDAHGLKGQVRLHSGDGHIEADDLDGNLNADSGDGHIRVRGRFDSLTLKTGDGSVSADATSGSKLSGDWNLRSGDGSITLRLAEGFDADLEADTGDGSINLDFPVTVSGTVSRSRIHGKMGNGGPPLYIHTGDGSIHIEKI
ncbi:MAG TPA: DUF4097 family beta strand repeat-containing protein [Candidatus Acidoferrales bacterium]|nr:DUF4097 family beta strand repeat-containing protein [Candidatus Acidoferrales bacterium]